ncbi:alpha amylase [Cubamyces lactineus]|nr:alpha amylase [Cubamyces lactineus]
MLLIWDAFADNLLKAWERIAFWRNPTPALPNMRLSPRDGDENPLMVQFFTWDCSHPHMSWWKHFESEVPNLAALGVTQVWLPPPNKAMRKEGQGYDAYDLWDLGEFYQKGTIATRWGTKEELVKAMSTANAHGIDVLIDAVLNHKLGADRPEKFMAVPVDPSNRLKDLGPAREIEASTSGWTAFDFLGRGGKYSSFKWTYEHFSGLDWDHRTRAKGVYRIASPNHQGWSRWVDTELGNYDYLLGIDIDHRHPDVRKDLLDWGAWVLQTTGGAGFRLDAIKHMDRRFLLSFIKHVRERLGRNDLFSVAEYWSSNIELIKPYIRSFEGLVTFFDVPLHYNFHDASKAGSRYDLRKILDKTILKYRPGDAVTFVDNHDSIPQQIGQTLESWVGSNFKLQAYALILLYGEGHPCVFYGDLYPNRECYDENVAQGLRRLMDVRRKFAYGQRADYFQQMNCIGFLRKGDGSRGGCAVLVSNADCLEKQEGAGAGQTPTHTIRMDVGLDNVNAKYRSLFHPEGTTVEIGSDGWASFTCPFGGVQVWVKDSDVDS